MGTGRKDLNGDWKEGAFSVVVTALSRGTKVVQQGWNDDVGCPDQPSPAGVPPHSTHYIR